MQHALVALAGSPGLVGIDSGNQNNFVGNLLVQPAESGDIFQHRLLVVGRAGADDQQEFVGFAFKDLPDFFVPGLLDGDHFVIQREFLFYFLGNGELPVEIHAHNLYLFRQKTSL